MENYYCDLTFSDDEDYTFKPIDPMMQKSTKNARKRKFTTDDIKQESSTPASPCVPDRPQQPVTQGRSTLISHNEAISHAYEEQSSSESDTLNAEVDADNSNDDSDNSNVDAKTDKEESKEESKKKRKLDPAEKKAKKEERIKSKLIVVIFHLVRYTVYYTFHVLY